MELRTVNAVVTGGASGLGRATAERLVAAGGRVALLDRPASAGADVAKTLGPSALFMPADVTSAGEVDTALRAAAERFGGLNVLVNCAGIGDRKSTRLNSSHGYISYAVFCLKKKTRGWTRRGEARR